MQKQGVALSQSSFPLRYLQQSSYRCRCVALVIADCDGGSVVGGVDPQIVFFVGEIIH